MPARCTLEHEERLRAAGFSRVAGVDEAGRGPLAGPLVVAAVILPEGFSHPRLNDSKKLTARVRESVERDLWETPGMGAAVVVVSVEEIDALNILRATHEGMRRAVQALPGEADHALIDGLPVQPFPIPQTALVGGDGLSLSIAAASVLAKVARDRLMAQLDAEFPQYAFAKHKGYGTALHLERLKEYGVSRVHRRSFAPVRRVFMEKEPPAGS
jgi:ribonuclease HII